VVKVPSEPGFTVSSSCSIVSLPGRTRTRTIRKNPAAFFIVLVLVVVLDCFPVGQNEDEEE
jgi:hypothetical protein